MQFSANLVEHGYLVMPASSAAYLKYYANCYPTMNDVSDLAHYTLCFGHQISVAIPDDKLNVLCRTREQWVRDIEGLKDGDHLQVYKSFHLYKLMSPAQLYERYVQGIKWLADRVNIGALVARGGVNAWVMNRWGGTKPYCKWFQGPSDLALYHNIGNNNYSHVDGKYLITDKVTAAQAAMIMGVVLCKNGKRCTVMLGTYLMHRYYTPFSYEWMDGCSRLFERVAEDMEEMGVKARTENEWKEFMMEFYAAEGDPNKYCVKSQDIAYGIELLAVGYAEKWNRVAIKDLEVPEGCMQTMEE
ncbi:hypothetical protein EV421DRAFT_1912613 [Armillaria borealis]|uniref:Uncharacterized protein n=1 Tax=Armillaria borealis TaxID=47425 RepID=A0AA39MEL6_9AGAR|nr:hypothetical protein EV421DRAFT_1912613 [Armillaria borealis]